MTHYAQRMRNIGQLLQAESPDITYSHRINIERSVFVTAKWIAGRYLDYDLRSFNAGSRKDVEDRIDHSEIPRVVRDTVLMAFEVRAGLGKLTSTHAYVADDIDHGVFRGREEALKGLGRLLYRYAEQIVAVTGLAPS